MSNKPSVRPGMLKSLWLNLFAWKPRTSAGLTHVAIEFQDTGQGMTDNA